MLFEEKKIILKDGTEAIFKTPELSDAEEMLRYIRTACGETHFLLRYPEEWDGVSVEKEEEWISNLRASNSVMAIACYVNGRVVGNCEVQFRTQVRTAHRANIAIAILKDFWGKGIGSFMFEEMIRAAKEHGSEIMELEFVEGNGRARGLYEKFGFKVVSERPNVIKLKDGTYLGDFYMQKYLK